MRSSCVSIDSLPSSWADAPVLCAEDSGLLSVLLSEPDCSAVSGSGPEAEDGVRKTLTAALTRTVSASNALHIRARSKERKLGRDAWGVGTALVVQHRDGQNSCVEAWFCSCCSYVAQTDGTGPESMSAAR